MCLKKIGFIYLLVMLFSFTTKGQEIAYLNKFKIPIQDTSKYAPFFKRIIETQGKERKTEIITTSEQLVYQKVEELGSDSNPISSKEFWYTEEGILQEKTISDLTKDRSTISRFFPNGNLESIIEKKADAIVSEKYFFETGKKRKKPIIESALPVGGLEAWNIFLGQNLRYPPSAQRMGYEGTVFVSFIVTTDGQMEDIELTNPEENHFLLNQEALRVVKLYTVLWNPFKIDGEVQKTRMRMPIRFKLTD